MNIIKRVFGAVLWGIAINKSARYQNGFALRIINYIEFRLGISDYEILSLKAFLLYVTGDESLAEIYANKAVFAVNLELKKSCNRNYMLMYLSAFVSDEIFYDEFDINDVADHLKLNFPVRN